MSHQSVSRIRVRHDEKLTPNERILLEALDEAQSYLESLQNKSRSQNTKLAHGDAIIAILEALDYFENNLPGVESK